MAVQPQRGFTIDRRVEYPARAGRRLAAQYVQAGGVTAQARGHVGERLQVLVGGQFPKRASGPRIDAAAESAEGGVGVDRHDAVLLAQLGEDRTEAGGNRRLPDAALAQHPHLVGAAQDGPNVRFVFGLLALCGGRAQFDQAEGGDAQDAPPAMSVG